MDTINTRAASNWQRVSCLKTLGQQFSPDQELANVFKVATRFGTLRDALSRVRFKRLAANTKTVEFLDKQKRGKVNI